MNKILGLIDALEAQILDSPKVPFSRKIMVDEKRVLDLLDKLRFLLKSDENMILDSLSANTAKAKAINLEKAENSLTARSYSQDIAKANEIIRQAQTKYDQISQETKNYLDYILANVQMMVAKMQKNLINIEKSLDKTRVQVSQQTENFETMECKLELEAKDESHAKLNSESQDNE